MLDFSELPPAREVDAALAATPIRNASARWREGLTPAQQRILDDLLREDLRRFGYDAAVTAEAARDAVAR